MWANIYALIESGLRKSRDLERARLEKESFASLGYILWNGGYGTVNLVGWEDGNG
jgi:hypothetical protein